MTGILLPLALLCVASSTAAAADAARWDQGLQGSEWQRRVAHELVQQHNDAPAAALLPCPVPPVTAPLPEGPLPAELESMLADLQKDLETMFLQSGATGGSASLV